MALLDENKNKKPFISDRDEDVFIGFKLPVEFGSSMDTSTTTTMEAVTHNLKNLILTERGERVMQPNLGVNLKKYLFEPFNEDTISGIKLSITDTLAYWMPFVQINKINVEMDDNETESTKGVLTVYISFSLIKDLSTVESLQVRIGE